RCERSGTLRRVSSAPTRTRERHGRLRRATGPPQVSRVVRRPSPGWCDGAGCSRSPVYETRGAKYEPVGGHAGRHVETWYGETVAGCGDGPSPFDHERRRVTRVTRRVLHASVRE